MRGRVAAGVAAGLLLGALASPAAAQQQRRSTTAGFHLGAALNGSALSTRDSVDVTGVGFTGGGGLAWFLSPSLALDVGLDLTFGHFSG